MYKLWFTSNSTPDHLTSAQIRAMLDSSNPEHAKHIGWIDDLERNKMRYSNQDYDVLSSAYAAAMRSAA